jgi:Protein of unknown function (DUF3617)
MSYGNLTKGNFMKMSLLKTLLFACALMCLGFSVQAADRVRAGQWDQTLDLNGRTMTRSTCLSQADADAINGDAKSIRAYVERISAPAACKVTDVRADGSKVTVTTVCAAGKENVGTTTYHGDSSETVNTNGTKSQAKWVGPCK